MAETRLILGDCLEAMKGLEPGSVDAVVTDPPYGLEFMGQEWDSFAPARTQYHGERADTRKNIGADDTKPASRHHVNYSMTAPVFRRCTVCGRREFSGSPCWCGEPQWDYEVPEGTPTRMAAYQKWCQGWAGQTLRVVKPGGYLLSFGGTRTWHRLACALEDAGWQIRDTLMWVYGSGFPKGKACLKPAWEPIILARKPGPKVLPLQIDACRVPAEPVKSCVCGKAARTNGTTYAGGRVGDCAPRETEHNGAGRWPANLIHDGLPHDWARYFYCPKASRAEREAGLEGLPDTVLARSNQAQANASRGNVVSREAGAFNKARRVKNNHPTVKPLALMRWLVRLVAPPGGTVLDPFLGSGTTALACALESFGCVGIEREKEYLKIAHGRLGGGYGDG